MIKIPESLEEAIKEDPDRFVKEFKNPTVQTQIKDFFSFQKTGDEIFKNNNLYKYFESNPEIARKLFESKTIQDIIEKNVGRREAQMAQQEAQQLSPEEIKRGFGFQPEQLRAPTPLLNVKGYNRVKEYQRSKPVRFTKTEEMFIRERKRQNKSPQQIFAEYQRQLGFTPRTKSSISTKLYRV